MVRLMSAPLKIAGFAAVLCLVFAAAALAGSLIDPGVKRADEEGGHGGMASGAAADAVRGLARRRGRPAARRRRPRAAPRPARDAALPRSSTPRGAPVRDFDVEHEQRMHLIVVRRDLTGFQHLHPDAGAPTAPGRRRVTLRDAGSYRVFADFSRDGEAAHARDRPARRRRRRPRAAARAAPTAARDRRLRGPPRRGRAAGRRPSCASRSRATARPSQTEPYLGAGGHLVALREGDLAFLHVHPTDDGVALRGRRSRPRAATACSSSSSTTAASTPRLHAGGGAMSAEHVELPITGMTCASCANRIERRLNKLDGVTRVGQLRDRAGDRRLRPGAVAPERARRGGRGRRLPGRAARRPSPASRDEADETAPLRRRLLVSAAADAAGAAALDDPAAAVRQLAVALAAARHAGRRSGARGRSTAPRGRTCATATATMDTLISRRRARRVRLVAVRAVPRRRRRCPGMRMAFDLIPDARAATRRDLPRGRRRRDRRSCSPAATSRRAPSAAPAPR